MRTNDVAGWAEVIRAQGASWADTYIYSKYEESGMGLKLALQLSRLFVEDRSFPT